MRRSKQKSRLLLGGGPVVPQAREVLGVGLVELSSLIGRADDAKRLEARRPS